MKPRPIDTAPKKGHFLIWLPVTEKWWPAYATGGGVVSNAHGMVNLEGDKFSPKATHWIPNPPAPTE